MALNLNKGKSGDRTYEEHPRGTFAMTLADVVDEGLRDTPWGEKHEYRLSFLTTAKMSGGLNFMISTWVRKSLSKGPKGPSHMVSVFEALRNQEIEAFDLTAFEDELELMESCIGRGCLGVVTQKPGKDGKVRSRLDAAKISPIPDGMVHPPIPGEFKRKRDRDGYAPPEKSPKQKIAHLWATAEDRSVTLVGDASLKEQIVREVYANFNLGSTAEAIESPDFERIIYALQAWTAPKSEQKASVPEVAGSDVPF